MPSLIDIRRRVRSVKNTQQITKAMKMVSAAKLRKAQEKAIAARPYAKMLHQMLANVAEAAAGAGDGATHPLLVVRPEKKILLVVVTADGGLAGGFNANLIKMAHTFAKQHSPDNLSFELIGRKGRDYFRRRYAHIAGEHTDVFRNVKFECPGPRHATRRGNVAGSTPGARAVRSAHVHAPTASSGRWPDAGRSRSVRTRYGRVVAMSNGLLEVIALDARDARAAVDGGADRIELVSGMEFAGVLPGARDRGARCARRWTCRCG